jgi:hypothetical protein
VPTTGGIDPPGESLSGGVPHAGGGDLGHSVREVAGLAVQGVLDAVGLRAVPAVEELGDERGQWPGELARGAVAEDGVGELVPGDRLVAEGAARRPGDLADAFGEGPQAGDRQLLALARVAVLGESGRRDVGDVVGVDERVGVVAGGQSQHAVAQRLEERTLVEVPKFWLNDAGATMVHSTGRLITAFSHRTASSWLRADSRTTRRTPASTASPVTAPMASPAPGHSISG